MKPPRIHAAEPPALGHEPQDTAAAQNLCGNVRSKSQTRTYNIERVTCVRCCGRIRKYPQLRGALAAARQPVLF
ncbi:hypothetical protein LCGC14_0754560 [marine sediment metagenome]|uniref:Uncharacterized protein n=1 Tax=marine sediment metagenome TaxID=412755 RepID=A0A0F9SN51_9ZZZZ